MRTASEGSMEDSQGSQGRNKDILDLHLIGKKSHHSRSRMRTSQTNSFGKSPSRASQNSRNNAGSRLSRKPTVKVGAIELSATAKNENEFSPSPDPLSTLSVGKKKKSRSPFKKSEEKEKKKLTGVNTPEVINEMNEITPQNSIIQDMTPGLP